ncbi:MAG TPA: hypothetical protein VFO55_04160 [Gemmatimonadaceae bacterium]|nr:hypothetical protein [Gemmatimonadaceae bacterium]
MKRYIVFAFAIQTLTSPDRWLSQDKAKHFFLGAFVQGAAYASLQATGMPRTATMAGASAISLAAVSAKELRDRSGAGQASVKDAIWGLAGAAAISPVLARTK